MSWKLYYANPDGSNEQSVNLEGLGALEGGQVTGDGVQFKFSSHKASEVTLKIPLVDPKNIPAIPFTARVRLVDGNGVQQFAGRRIDWDGNASAEKKGFSYQFQDAWWDLSKITFKHEWFSGGYMPVTVAGSVVTFGGGAQVNFAGPFPSVQFYDANHNQIGSQFNVASVSGNPAGSFTVSGGVGTATGAKYICFVNMNTDVVLFQYRPGDPYQNAGQVVNYYITTGAQIREILTFAISLGVQLQIGQIDPALFVPWYPARCQNCAECIKICLRDHPDCFTEIDYTTVPPTFNVRSRANLTPKLLPYAYTDANGIQHISTDIKPRPDLVPSRIGIFYRYVINGTTVAFPQDIYPVNEPDGLLALDYSIDLQGPRMSASFGQITSRLLPSADGINVAMATFNPASPTDWWISKHPQFANNDANGGNTAPDILGNTGSHIALCDSAGGVATPDISVVDQNGNDIDLTVYRWEMVGGGQALWMSGINCKPATVRAYFNYKKMTVNPDKTVSTASKDALVDHELVSVNVNLVNTASIQQAYYAFLTSGEAIPANLAQSIYASLQTMQYNLRQSSREEPFTSFVKPGRHCVNLAGGNPAWGTMNATVQESTYTLRMRPDGAVWAVSDISCGPVEHLEAGQLVQLFNIFANRDLSKIDPWERITGQTGNGGNQSAVANTPKENSVTGWKSVSFSSVTFANVP